MSDELKKLANAPVLHPVAGRELHLTPMKLMACLRAQEVIEPFVGEMADGDINVTQLMMRHATRMFDLAVVMLAGVDPKLQKIEREWMAENLGEPEYEGLLTKLIDVNQDFFVRRVHAIAQARAQEILAAAQAGLLMSLGSQTSPSESQLPADGTGPTPSST